MTENTKAEIIIEANAQQPVTEAARLAQEFSQLTTQIGRMEQAFKKAFSGTQFTSAIRAVEDMTSKIEASQKKLEGVRNLTGRKIAAYAEGNEINSRGTITVGKTAKTNAALNRSILELETTTEQLHGRYAEALIRAHARGLKKSDEYIAAATRQQIANRDRLLAQSTESVLRASSMKMQETLRRLEIEYSPENLAASQRLFAYRMSQRRLDTGEDVLGARGAKAGLNRDRLVDLYGDTDYVSSIGRNRAMQDDLQKKIANDLPFQKARVAQKELDYLREREELLDQQLQAIKQDKYLHKRRRLTETVGDEAWVRGRDEQEAFNDRRTKRRGEIGVHAEQTENVLDRLSHDGGAGIMAIQTRIMVGYMALSGAINMARGLSTFVVQLDKEFRQFQAITNATSGEMVQVKKDLIDVSEATKFTALEVAQAATILGQAGMSAQNVRDSISAITLLATAAGSDLNDAVEAVTSTLSIFNLQATQAEQIANSFTAALNGSKLSMDKITLGLQYAGNTAAQFGVTYQELTAAMGAMANSGIKSGSTLGTGMRMLMVSLTEPTKKFKAELDKLGLSQADVDVKSKGLTGVMQTLAKAGFGASEAYKSFEVRAASAYAALSNNLELGIKLEESFVDSTAAVKANETQMEALANQYDRLKSTMGTLAYESMAPFLDMLSDGVSLLADAASGAREFSGGLQGIAVLLAGGGTLLALKTLSALGRGLFMGLNLGSLTTGLSAGAVAATTMTTRVGMLSKALTVLNAVGKANIFVMGASLAAMGATAFYAFIKGADDAAKRMELLNTMVSRYRQEIDTTEQRVSAIDQVINNLRERQMYLETADVERRLKIKEVISQFTELGQTVSASTSSVEDLIDALEQLRDVDLGKQIDKLNALVQSYNLVAAQTAQNRTDVIKGITGDTDSQKDVTSYLQRVLKNADPAAASVAGNLTNQTTLATMAFTAYERIAPEKGTTAILDLEQLRASPARVSQNTSIDWNNKLLQSKTYLDALQASRAELEIKAEAGTITGKERQLLAATVAHISFVNEVIEKTTPLIESMMTEVQNRNNAKRAQEEARLVELDKFVNADPALRQARDDQLAALQGYARGMPDFIDHDQVAFADREQFAKDMLAQIEFYEKEVEALTQQMRIQGYKPEEIEAAVETMMAPVDAAKRTLLDLIDEDSDAVDKGLKEIIERERKRHSKAINDAKSKLMKAESVPQTELYKKLGLKILDDIELYEYDLLQKALAKTTNDEQRQILMAEYNEAKDGRNDLRNELMATAVKQSQDIEAKILQGRIDGLKAQEAQIQQKIDDLTRQIQEGGAGLDFSGLMTSLRGLWGQLKTVADQRVRLETENLPASSGSGSGYAKLAFLESGERGFSARGGYNNHYVGRFQFGQARLDDYSAATGKGKINREAFRNFPALQEEVERWHFNDILSKIRSGAAGPVGQVINGVVMDEAAMMAVAHKQGFGGLQRYMISGIDQKDGFGTTNSKYARALSGTDVSSYEAFRGAAGSLGVQVAEENRARQEAEDETTRTVRVKEIDANLEIGDQELQATVSRARAASTPAAVQKLLADTVRIMDRQDAQQLERFDVEHAGDRMDPVGREQLIRSLAEKRNAQITEILDAKFGIEEDALDDALTAAQQRVQEMEKPENVNRFSEEEKRMARKAQKDAENALTAQKLAQVEGEIVAFKNEQVAAAQKYGGNSEAALYWNEQLAAKERERVELNRELSITSEVNKGGNPKPFQDALETWQVGTGYYEETEGEIRMKESSVRTREAWDQVLAGMTGGFENFFMSMGEGFDGLVNSVKGFGLEIAKMLQQMLAKTLAVKTVMMLAKGPLAPIFGDTVQFLGAMNGTIVPRRAAAGSAGVPGRDSVPYLLEPGEAVLRRSAVSIVGEDKIKSLNNLGNRQQDSTYSWPEHQKDSGVINVWVVTPDQQQPLGEKDILAVVHNDLINRGQTKQLIKSIQMGQL